MSELKTEKDTYNLSTIGLQLNVPNVIKLNGNRKPLAKSGQFTSPFSTNNLYHLLLIAR